MAFNEKIKLQAKEMSAFRCCICHKPFVEVHHIVPRADGGSDELENTAPLCASCHDLYGGNPEKQKTIRQMRDHWWGLMQRRRANLTENQAIDRFAQIEENLNHRGSLCSKGIAIYHLVFANENFETAVKHLHELVLEAQSKYPNQRRLLFLDIEGHKNEAGGYDHDMFELQRHFLLGFMMQFISQLNMPLVAVQNNNYQKNNIPKRIGVLAKLDQSAINDAIDKGMSGIWIADKDKWVSFDET